MSRQEILMTSEFGAHVAEEESRNLEAYFVETNEWLRLIRDEIDIIYGPKGSGKSALYSLLIRRASSLSGDGIIILPAEELRGKPVFKDLEQDSPSSENEFIALWKLYFLSLIGASLRENRANSEEAKKVVKYLENSNLIEQTSNLRSVLRKSLRYARRCFPESIGANVEIDPYTGLPKGFGGKISFGQPQSDAKDDIISFRDLLEASDVALSRLGVNVWILLDRLDVAFMHSPLLEAEALRALFRTYLDFRALENVRLKIFLRSDIWKTITKQGFREADHVIRYVNLEWNEHDLLNLVVSRMIQDPNRAIRSFYSVDYAEVSRSYDKQHELFYRIFPKEVEGNRRDTFRWILNRTRDGNGENTPRVLIHLLNCSKEIQLNYCRIGREQVENDNLFSKAAIKDSLPEVSRAKLEQTLYAEFPDIRSYIKALAGEKTLQHPESLTEIWDVSPNKAIEIAEKLCAVGFFEYRGTKRSPKFWVPHLYRYASSMIQGSAG